MISKSVDWDEEKLKQIIVHEMIHHYVHTIDGISLDGLFQHGFHFVRQTKNTLSQRLTHVLGNKLHLY